MESIDIAVLRALRDWRAQGMQALLATVVRTWGSSPRPIGAMMVLREDGRSVGSVSGGCIEDDLIHQYTQAFGTGDMRADAPTKLVRYGVTADEAHRFGLPCGGTLELLLEFNPDPDSLTALMAQLDAGRLVQRRVCRRTGQVTLTQTETPDALQCDAQSLVNTLGPGYRMLLIGAGALTDYLSTMALFNGFSVTVCDPRLHGAAASAVASATVTTAMPDDAVIAFAPDARSCVIALTHDPKLDDLALLEAIHSPAFYVGAIGSRRNNALRRARMIEHLGETEETLRALRGPIGIYIGSKTPAEIAVSIMAEVLAVKNGVKLPEEMDVGTAKTLAQDTAQANHG